MNRTIPVIYTGATKNYNTLFIAILPTTNMITYNNYFSLPPLNLLS